jgi:hypothetical protein
MSAWQYVSVPLRFDDAVRYPGAVRGDVLPIGVTKTAVAGLWLLALAKCRYTNTSERARREVADERGYDNKGR